MSSILFNIIQKKIYKTKEFHKVTKNSLGISLAWIFDFKSQSLSKVFLKEYADNFWKSFPDLEGKSVQIGGMESGAISLVTGISIFSSENININNFYIRKSRKKSDLANLVEGNLEKNTPIILVDDIINKGDTIRKQIKILEDLGYTVYAIFVCLRYRNIIEYKDLIDKGIEIKSIFELNDFSHVLPVTNMTSEIEEVPLIQKYSFDYKVTLTQKPNLYLVVPKVSPVLVNEYIYIGVDDGLMYCLNEADGSVVWTYKVTFGTQAKYILSSPVIYRDKIIFGAYDGNVYCLNRFTGKVDWIFFDADWVGSSPSIDEERGVVFIGLEFGLITKKGGVVAINISNGEAIWKYYSIEGLVHASPSYSKKYNMVVCGSNDSNVYAFNAQNGALLWQYKTSGDIKYGSVFDEIRNTVIVGNMEGKIYILNVKTGLLEYIFTANFGFYSTPAIKNDLLVIGSLDKNVYCFNLHTKKNVWKSETFGRIFASPLIVDLSVYIGSNDGKLYELDLNDGKKISTTQLTERIVNKIQVGINKKDGKRRLYIPTHTGELYKMTEK